MFSVNEKYFTAKDELQNKIQLLIIGRLLVIFLLLVATWVWNSGHLKLSFENFPQSLFIAFVIFVGLTIAYFFILRLNKSYSWQIITQFFLDALLITWLVWQTGDLGSPYITLYTMLIAISSIFFKARGTLLLALFCISLFTILCFSTTFAFIGSSGASRDSSKIIQILAFNIVGCLVVGLLASRLSNQNESGAKLRKTEKDLINLRVLHERIVESIRSGLITTDLNGKIYTFNQSAEEITGFKSSEMVGNNISQILGDIERAFIPAIERTETGNQPIRYETDIFTPEGFAVHIGYRNNRIDHHISGSDRHSFDGRKYQT